MSIERQKLDRWIEKLLDTGKRNNLINFKDAKLSTAEIVFPDDETIFSHRDLEYTYAVYEPPIDEYVDEDNDDEFNEDEILDEEADSNDHKSGKLSPKEEYVKRYSKRINSKGLLVYSATTNPITALKGIAKKARELQDETGVNASYLAFGFVRWKEKDDSKVSYKAPILLVHANVITGSVIDPVKIQISGDEVVVNPTFNYKLQSDFGVSLPDFDDDYTLDDYFSEVAEITDQLGWEIVRECKLGIFSFLKLTMYEDLKNNADQILKNNVVKTLIGASSSRTVTEATNYTPLKNPLVELHTVVDADSSQMEAVEMAKSGKSFVLQGPPGTGKSQTITNIIAECLYDGKKVLFVSEKQAALNVVFEKLKSVGLEDFCLELHSHKANKKTVIEELNRTLESPRISVSPSAEEEIRQRINTIASLDAYAIALHKRRDVVGTSLFELFERYSALRHLSDFNFRIPDIQSKGTDYFHKATKLLDEYVSFLQDVGNNYRENAWYGFTDAHLKYNQKNQLREDIETLIHGYEALLPISTQFKRKYDVPISNFISAQKWAPLLSFLVNSDVITPHLLVSDELTSILSKVKELKSQSDFIATTERKRESEISLLCNKSEHILARIKNEASSKKEEIQKEFDSKNNDIKRQLDIDLSKLQLQLENAIRKVQDRTTSELDSLRIKHESDTSSINKSAFETLEAIHIKYDKDLTSEKERSSSELSKIQSRHDQVIEKIKSSIFEYYSEDIIDIIDGTKLYDNLNSQFHSVFSRIFNNEYKIYIETTLKPYFKKDTTLSYRLAKKTAILLKNLREEQEQFDKICSENKNILYKNVQQLEISYKEDLEKTNFSFEEQLREIHRSFDEEIANKESESELQLRNLQKSYEDTVNKKKAEHDTKVLENQKSYEERIGKINDIFNIKLPNIKQQHESVIEKKSSEYEKKVNSLRKKFDENETHVKEYLGPAYKGLNSDWNHIIDSLNKILRIHLNDTVTPLIPLASAVIYRHHGQFERVKNDIKELQQIIDSINCAQNRIKSLFSCEILDFNNQAFNKCLYKLRDCLDNFDKIDSWVAFIKILQKIETESLLSYIDQTIESQISANQIVETFKKVFYKNWIDYILYTDQRLSSFTRNRQDHNVAVFSEKDKTSFDICKVQIKEKLSRMRPNLNVISGGGPVAILRREGKKKRKQLPIRKLLSETNELTQILKPCFLMSPLSVSSLLDPDKISFDVVIFDEASQVFPQDALGAIYRAKQIIVVGDSKQMPPSNFFNTSSDSYEDEEEEDVSDFESILDICSSVFTTKRLLWHYRSRYEDLISFSNVHFYESSLMTFPSASTDGDDVGVNHHFVAGIFDRKTKTNEKEAEYIVDLVFKNIVEHPERSLGVVAFSISQQKLIDKLITRRRERNSSFEWFFDSNRPGSFFVKNLETVQGDERDTIIFSVAYARDAEGRFLHNFGPLNREGGERRLNVAITRAKDNVQFVSSIRHTDIDTGAAKSEGARLLKAYLNFAENGNTTLEPIESPSNSDFLDQNENLEQEIAEFLRDHGYVVDLGIGNSTSKIDLGVKTTKSNNYVMAIECDGRYYRKYKNARDRDRLRRFVLENMGWNYYRIWSTNWIRNKSIEQNLLLLALKEAEKNVQIVQKNKKPCFSFENSTEIPPTRILYNETEKKISNTSKRLNEFENKTDNENFPRYKQLNAMEIMFKHRATTNKDNFQDAVLEILSEEAPISEKSFLKRIVGVFERERVSKHVDQEYKKKISNCVKKGIIRRDGFLYLRDQKYTFRIPGDKREINNIAIEELSEGLLKLIEENIKIERENLYKILARLLCVSNTWTTRKRFNEALELLKKKDLAREEGGFLRLKSSSK